MNILVIGGSGFIGSHLVNTLEENKYNVKILDIVKPYRNDIKFINTNILDFKSLVKNTKNIDIIYHLASHRDISNAFNSPLEFLDTNIKGTLNVLEAIRKNNVKRIIFSSSVWVYSTANEKKVTESTLLDPSKANHLYTLSKIMSEIYIRKYKELYGQDFTILRYGVTYGPRVNPNAIIPLFIKKALNNEELTIYGDGKQTRNLINIKDLIQGNLAVLSNIAKNKIYNLDGINPISINELFDLLQELLNKKLKVKYEKAREGDYQGKIVSVEKAKKDLNWQPKILLKQGIEEYLNYIKQ